jgi:hypothetical protein
VGRRSNLAAAAGAADVSDSRCSVSAVTECSGGRAEAPQARRRAPALSERSESKGYARSRCPGRAVSAVIECGGGRAESWTATLRSSLVTGSGRAGLPCGVTPSSEARDDGEDYLEPGGPADHR